MLTLETIIACALRHPVVMDQLGEALRSDLVTANPFYRRIVEFSDAFLAERRKLPGYGDWELWLDSLERGMLRDGTKEALGRLWAVDVSTYDPDFLATSAIGELQRVAAQVARARLNELPTVEPAALVQLAEKVAAVQASTRCGLAKRFFPTLGEIIVNGNHADDVAPEELIPRLAWRSRHTLLSAAPKLGKSTFVAAGVAAFTRGRRFLDGIAGVSDIIDPETGKGDPERRVGGRVLWLAMDEAVGDAAPRLYDNGASRLRVVVMNPDAPDKLLARVLSSPEDRPDVVVVDSLIEYARRVSPEMPASGDAGAWGQVMRPLTQFTRDFPVGIVTIHHGRKSDGRMRDSGEIKAAADAVIEMHEAGDKQPPEVRNMTVIGRRSVTTRGERYTIRLTSVTVETPTPAGMQPVRRDVYQLGHGSDGAGGAGSATSPVKRILAFVGEHPGCSQQEILKSVGGDRTDTHKELKAMEAAGQIRSEKQGRRLAYFPAGEKNAGIGDK